MMNVELSAESGWLMAGRREASGGRERRDERDSRDMRALSLPVALFPPVSPVSLEWGLHECRRCDR